jgi:hypothetical protein
MWQLIGGGVVIALGGLFIYLAFRNTEAKGRAEAQREAEEKAAEINAGMTDIQGTLREPSGVIDPMKKGTFVGQK